MKLLLYDFSVLHFLAVKLGGSRSRHKIAVDDLVLDNAPDVRDNPVEHEAGRHHRAEQEHHGRHHPHHHLLLGRIHAGAAAHGDLRLEVGGHDHDPREDGEAGRHHERDADTAPHHIATAEVGNPEEGGHAAEFHGATEHEEEAHEDRHLDEHREATARAAGKRVHAVLRIEFHDGGLLLLRVTTVLHVDFVNLRFELGHAAGRLELLDGKGSRDAADNERHEDDGDTVVRDKRVEELQQLEKHLANPYEPDVRTAPGPATHDDLLVILVQGFHLVPLQRENHEVVAQGVAAAQVVAQGNLVRTGILVAVELHGLGLQDRRGRLVELHRHRHVLAADTRPDHLVALEGFGIADHLAFDVLAVIENHFAEEVAGTAEALALREFFRFLHAALPSELVFIGLETDEAVHLTHGNTRLGKGVATDDLVSADIFEDELDARIGVNSNPFRCIDREQSFAQVGLAESEVEGTESRILDEFREVAGTVSQGFHDNAADLAALVVESHDKLVRLDRHRARKYHGLCGYAVGGSGVSCSGRGIGHGTVSGSLVGGRSPENRSSLDFGFRNRKNQLVGGFRLGGLGSGGFAGLGFGCGLRVGVRRVRRHPPDDDDGHEDGTDNGILVHLLSFLGGTGS